MLAGAAVCDWGEHRGACVTVGGMDQTEGEAKERAAREGCADPSTRGLPRLRLTRWAALGRSMSEYAAEPLLTTGHLDG
ncbi:MAG: hypothetical protein JWO67_5299 [Streptosporangiaceae bacterium]|nr:hypothetical protein [Streptosporangiaceae bacterium]